jgi:ATP-dependent exoDNAse (exonuclease V) beta subunit
VFANPAFAWIFWPEREGGRGLCEQPIIHRCGREGRTEVRLLGTIDRLVLRPGRADVVDFKSNRVVAAEVPALVEHYRAQIAAYRDALAALWPERRIGGWLLFTHVGTPAGQGLLVEVAPCP